jgi:hypothetical protein
MPMERELVESFKAEKKFLQPMRSEYVFVFVFACDPKFNFALLHKHGS